MATITATFSFIPPSPAPGLVLNRITINPNVNNGTPQLTPTLSAPNVPNYLYKGNQPATQLNNAGLSAIYTDLYYYRIHVVPSSFDAGNVSTTVSYQVEVWNSFFVTRNLTMIDTIDADGINILNGIAPGANFGPLESSVYDIEVTPDGPPAIEATLKWTFGVDFGSHVITGTRLVLFAFRAAGPITERFEWLTNVMRAYNGEQRIALRKHPRQSWDMRYKQSQADIQSRMNSAMWGRNYKPFGLPIWTDVTYIYEGISAGTTVIYLDTQYFDYRESGLLLLLYTSDLNNEAKEILEVHPDRLVLKRPLEKNFPDGALAMPVVICQPEGGMIREDIGNDVTVSKIRFRAIDNLERVTSPVSTYKGYEIIDDYNIRRSQNVASAILHPSVTVDGQTGPWDTFAFRQYPDEIVDWSWVADTPQKRWENKMFLMRQRGRQKVFWIRTRREDFILAETWGQSTTTMPVKNMGQELLELYPAQVRWIEVVLNDGTVFTRQIVGLSSESPDRLTQYIEVDAAPPSDILITDVKYIGYLRLMRFDSDVVDIEHAQGIYSQFTMPLITVEQPTS